MKDLFTGSLGKLNNHGGSRMFTTPNTVLVPPDYEIETGLPSEAEFVTCSLDGRLWLFQRKNWYYILALKWNEATEKLELAELKIIQKENFIQRGIDWLITDTLFIFIENNVNIILKKHEIKISDLQNIDEQYYYLPAAGEWQILGRYLINRGKKPTSYLTFSGPGFENNNCNIRTVNHHNGIIWTLITEYSLIGRSYIFPVSFLENEDIVDDDFYEYALDYYFYVRSDFEYIDNDGEKKAFIFLDENYPHICRITDIRNNFCLPSKNERIYDLQNRKRIYISNKYTIDTFNNKIFFDINDNNKTYSLNVLGDNLYTEQKFISDKNLQEWINPSDKEIQSISQNNIIFTLNDNNDIVITHLNSELYREILLANKLPLTCRTYGQYQLSLGLKEDNSITVNKLESRNINIPHVTCYQRPFEFKNFNIIDKNGTIVPRGNFYRIETRDWTINLAYGYTHFSYTIKWYDVDNNVWKQSFRAYDMAEEARAYWERHEHKDCYNGIRTVLQCRTESPKTAVPICKTAIRAEDLKCRITVRAVPAVSQTGWAAAAHLRNIPLLIL